MEHNTEENWGRKTEPTLFVFCIECMQSQTFKRDIHTKYQRSSEPIGDLSAETEAKRLRILVTDYEHDEYEEPGRITKEQITLLW